MTDFMVSYDVRDLFTSILIPHSLNVLQSLLDSDSSLRERTKLSPLQIVKLESFCMREGNYFRFQEFLPRERWGSNGRSVAPGPCRTVHATPGRDSVRGNGQPMGPPSA
ncbi:hypothetical protein M513_14301 [Trichuris suis]|uniref:Uncharacterized protein n=1 Tax=Trichuris suis TaxID=68888 RepID=A0A085LIM5_9BILA|nr:hypothetical protein M513_14301 [Trichuris suis]